MIRFGIKPAKKRIFLGASTLDAVKTKPSACLIERMINGQFLFTFLLIDKEGKLNRSIMI